MKIYKKWNDNSNENFLMLLIIKLKVHPILDLIVFQSNVVFVNDVPFLQHQLVMPCPCLSCNQSLQIPNCVRRITLDTDLLTQPIITGDLNHLRMATKQVVLLWVSAEWSQHWRWSVEKQRTTIGERGIFFTLRKTIFGIGANSLRTVIAIFP